MTPLLQRQVVTCRSRSNICGIYHATPGETRSHHTTTSASAVQTQQSLLHCHCPRRPFCCQLLFRCICTRRWRWQPCLQHIFLLLTITTRLCSCPFSSTCCCRPSARASAAAICPCDRQLRDAASCCCRPFPRATAACSRLCGSRSSCCRSSRAASASSDSCRVDQRASASGMPLLAVPALHALLPALVTAARLMLLLLLS